MKTAGRRAVAVLAALLAAGLTGCTSPQEPDYISLKAKSLDMSGAAEDAKLPTELFDELMKVYRPQLEDKEATNQESESQAKLKIPTDFFAFNVFLTEKTRGVLGGANYQLAFGKGGGVLDMKDYVNAPRGTFYLGVQPLLPEHENSVLKVYFLSNSARWDNEGVPFGAGCGVYMDISDYYNLVMPKTGIIVNVASQRHVGLLAGTFFFAISIKGQVYLSQLTVRDSRYKNLHCR